MPKTEKELLKRDAQRDIGSELLASIEEMKAGKAGRAHTISLSEVTQARAQSGLSQSQFARMMGVSIRTLQEWEQNRRKPSGAAQALLTVVTKRPDVIREIFSP